MVLQLQVASQPSLPADFLEAQVQRLPYAFAEAYLFRVDLAGQDASSGVLEPFLAFLDAALHPGG